MIKQIELTVLPKQAFNKELIAKIATSASRLNPEEIKAIVPIRRSIDARGSKPRFKILVNVFINESPQPIAQTFFKPVQGDKKVIIIGSGPGGLFAALKLIQLGIKPIIFERGKDVQSRRRDLKEIQQDGLVNPDSNYCFGEGGAGTYSDGKLYTRSTKRGDVKNILNLFVQHGADEDILIDAHPHIGSNKLPKVVQNLRDTIQNNGGQIHFNSRVTDFILHENKIAGVVVNEEQEFIADAVILATGHSARDIYYLLDKRKIKIEAKPFAMGVRIEHPQGLIDSIQYHTEVRDEYLPASSYNLTCQIGDCGVFSFCMCPGGIIVPASTALDELVLNGMSVSKRDSQFANAGIVVSIKEHDWKKYNHLGAFAGLELQKELERTAFEAGGKTQRAPAQRITDFVNRRISSTLPETSYIPGIVSSPLHEILPKNISKYLGKALLSFGKRMKGYFTEEAQILAPESRTSSPIRIPRNNETLMHVEVEGLFPCGEGAGYAGGIISAAIDGENCASAAAKFILTN